LGWVVWFKGGRDGCALRIGWAESEDKGEYRF